jgi:hypothetical protein
VLTQARIGLAIRAQPDQRHRFTRSPGEGLGQLIQMGDGAGGHAVAGCHGGVIKALRHGKQPLKVHRCPGPDRQLLKDAAATVIHQHHRELSAAGGQLLAPEPAIGVVQQGQITAEQG